MGKIFGCAWGHGHVGRGMTGTSVDIACLGYGVGRVGRCCEMGIWGSGLSVEVITKANKSVLEVGEDEDGYEFANERVSE